MSLLAGLLLAAVPAGPSRVELNGQTFTVAAGYTLEAAAGPDLATRPMSGSFDDAGNLYLTESSGSNAPVEQQAKDRPHRLVRLSDDDGDGRFDRRTVFAEDLMLPQGCLWHDGWVYTATPPTIERFRDADGDGIADEREVWFDGKTLSYCANDVHGPYAGPGGVLYWTKGAFEPQSHPRPGGDPFVTRAAHVFRRSPVNGAVEPVLTGGMDNPVEVAWTAAGDGFCCATFVTHPGGGTRDGIVALSRSGHYGKRHGVLDAFPHVGDLLPVTAHLGAAAPAGLCRPRVNEAPAAPWLACAQFNTRRVSRHRLRADGAAWASEPDVLLESDAFDFHPTDVLEDADGSLLIVDTGGWYKLCCPTSQVVRPDALGGVLRLRPNGPTPPDPRGRNLEWGPDVATADLVARLGDPRPAVADRAVRALAGRGEAVVPAVAAVLTGGSTEHRLAAVWCLCRVPGEAARAAVRSALGDDSPLVRRAALHAVALWRDPAAADAVAELLAPGDPLTNRPAADALAVIGEPRHGPALLASLGDAEQRPGLEQAVAGALIALNARDAAAHGLAAPGTAQVLAAVRALAALPGDVTEGERDRLASMLLGPPRLRAGVRDSFARREDWQPAVAGRLRDRLPGLTLPDEADVLGLAVRFGGRGEVRAVVADALPGLPPPVRAAFWRRVTAEGWRDVPADWAALLPAALTKPGEERAAALALLRQTGLPDDPAVAAAVRAVADDPAAGPAERLTAAAVLPSARIDADRLDELRSLLADPAAAGKGDAVRVLAAATFTEDARADLPGLLAEAGPLALPALLPIVRGGDDAAAAAALAAITGNPAFAAVPADDLHAAFAGSGEQVRAAVAAAVAEREEAAGRRRAGLAAAFDALPPGEPARGAAVFRSDAAACMTCHRIGEAGGDFGPSLFGIGAIRTKRDLHEAIVLPSAAFVRSYEPWVALTDAGVAHNGLVKNETDRQITLAEKPGEVITLDRADLLNLAPASVSLMPAGLDRQITDQQMADLLAFLSAERGWE